MYMKIGYIVRFVNQNNQNMLKFQNQGHGSIRWSKNRVYSETWRFLDLWKTWRNFDIFNNLAKPRCRRHRKEGSPLGGRKFEIYHFTNKIVVLPHYSMFLGQICVYKYLGRQENNIFTFIKSSRHGTLLFVIAVCD